MAVTIMNNNNYPTQESPERIRPNAAYANYPRFGRQIVPGIFAFI